MERRVGSSSFSAERSRLGGEADVRGGFGTRNGGAEGGQADCARAKRRSQDGEALEVRSFRALPQFSLFRRDAVAASGNRARPDAKALLDLRIDGNRSSRFDCDSDRIESGLSNVSRIVFTPHTERQMSVINEWNRAFTEKSLMEHGALFHRVVRRLLRRSFYAQRNQRF
jgi:hypothetical protein